MSYLHPELADQRDYVNQSGLSRQAIFNQVEASLARLDPSYIDLLQIHRADLNNVTAEETMKALHDLVQSGKVRYIGASSMWTWQFAHYNAVAEKVCLLICTLRSYHGAYAPAQNGWTQFISMQNHYSLTYREEEREMNAYCKFAGIGIIPWSPLSMGQLARPLSAQNTSRVESTKGTLLERQPKEWENEIVRRVEQVAKEKGWSMAQVSLAWINEKVTSPIVGFSSVNIPPFSWL
jgi:aryl-alcohol dehydrogenase-like predicted oxidoreductase